MKFNQGFFGSLILFIFATFVIYSVSNSASRKIWTESENLRDKTFGQLTEGMSLQENENLNFEYSVKKECVYDSKRVILYGFGEPLSQ